MSFRSLVQTLPVQFRQMTRQPGWWAVVSSVGFHGLLFVVLPLLPTPSSRASEPDILDPVAVVELGPDEIGRLPDFSDSDVTLPPLPDGEELYSFGDDFDEFSELDPDLPSSAPIPSPFPSLSTLPPLPPLPSRTPLPRPQTFGDLFRQSPSISPGSPLPSTEVEPAPVEEPEAPQAEDSPANSADDLRPQPTDEAAVPEPSEPSPPEPNPDEIAQQRQEALLAEQQRLQELFTFNPFGESDVENAFSAFNNSAKSIDATEGEPLTLSLPYPSGACPLNFEEGQVIQVVWGAFVDSEKQVLGSPEPILIYSSGYKFFDDIAREAIASGSFTELISNDAGVNRAYVVTVEFTYSSENCPMTSPADEDLADEPSSDGVAAGPVPEPPNQASNEG